MASYPVLLEKVTDFLLLNDRDVLPTILGAVAAHHFGGTPVWLLIVAPPSGTKTELLRALWGTGKELRWQGRLGFLAGVTPVIDSYHSVLSVLGERFVLFRMIQPDREHSARKSLDNAKVEPHTRAFLAGAVQSFLAGLPTTPPDVPTEATERLVNLANFATRCRSGVVRDRHRRELEYVPEPEMPARFVKQIFELLRGMALVIGHEEATSEDMDRVARVALDSIPAVRRLVLRAVATMLTVDDTLKTTAISQAVQYALSHGASSPRRSSGPWDSGSRERRTRQV